MKSLFRGLEERRREESVKSNLASELSKVVRELLEEHREEGVLRSAEASNSLVCNLEAIFIHGLKETILSKFSSVMAGPDQTPEPEFWSLVLVFSHRDVIRQVHRLTQITTDIGRCRAWIRLSLNDSLLSSYIETISAQNNALKPYYRENAFLRDSQLLTHLQQEINNVSNVVFEYPMNSCLLNYWPTPPLLLAGLWTPPIKLTSSDADRTDVASDIAAELPDDVERTQLPGLYSSIEQVLYNEDEALKIILGTPVEDSPLDTVRTSTETLDTSTQCNFTDDRSVSESPPCDDRHLISAEQQSDFKQDDEECLLFHEEAKNVQNVENSTVTEEQQLSTSPKRKSSINLESYDLLLKNYNSSVDHVVRFSSSPSDRQNNLENILQTYDLMTDVVPSPLLNPALQMSASFTIEQELKSMVDHLGRFMLEAGLISQDFLCKRCGQSIGLSFQEAKVCGLTGQYFCVRCFDEKESVIPARILHNWDFSKHSVSGKAFTFLEDVQSHPLLNIRTINPRLYLIVPEMEDLRQKRLKLNLLRMYLTTCREPVLEVLKKRLWPREYLYQHIHLYSVSDLLEIPSCALSYTLSQVIDFCEAHVIGCQLCSQKGYFCEVCNSRQIIYPFHLDTTYRCPKCSLVVHRSCNSEVDECPKCLRIQQRMSSAADKP